MSDFSKEVSQKMKRSPMSIERIVMAFAGTVVLTSLSLGVSSSPLFQHTNWLFLTAFVGMNLLQASFTGFCPLALLLKAMGKKTGSAF